MKRISLQQPGWLFTVTHCCCQSVVWKSAQEGSSNVGVAISLRSCNLLFVKLATSGVRHRGWNECDTCWPGGMIVLFPTVGPKL